jgi:stage III sporulation protein AG
MLKDKKRLGIIILIIIGIIFICIPSPKSNKEDNSDDKDYLSIVTETEEKLKKLILDIDGVKKVNVMICFSDMGVKEYYKDETYDYNDSKTKTDKKLVFKRDDGDEVPVLKREKYPEIKGVTVIADCEKRDREEIIFRAVRASLGIDSHKIEIIINDRSK